MSVRALILIALHASLTWAKPEPPSCNVQALTEAGWVCGVTRWAEDGVMYASFRGVPYATQPLGELRFKELQPLKPWSGVYDASTEGPVCPQTDVLYGRMAQPMGMSEACIHANIHVPLAGPPASRFQLTPGEDLPVLVFIHGGGFAFGSGDSDVYGPEYLVSKNVIVITFNYRLNAFGFLSLNSSSIPGNAGLRDMVTLLQWVKNNVRAFGGDPNRVTLGGQSAGAVAAHMLSLSPATKGLFQNVILMSGTAVSPFISSSPVFAQLAANIFLNFLAINETDPELVHQQLIEAPLEKIMAANKFLLDNFGLTSFVPVVESPHAGVTMIIDEDPETLIAKGRGKEYPLMVGFTDTECETFRKRFTEIDIVKKIKENPLITVPVNLIYTNDLDTVAIIAKKVDQRYFNGSIGMDGFLRYCTGSYYQYPVFKLAEKRAQMKGAPVFVYQFSYEGENSVLKEAFELNYSGAGHIEDLTYVFRTGSMLGKHFSFPPENDDDSMKFWMTQFFVSFMSCSEPTCGDEGVWPPVTDTLQYQDIRKPSVYRVTGLTSDQKDQQGFYDKLQRTTKMDSGS